MTRPAVKRRLRRNASRASDQSSRLSALSWAYLTSARKGGDAAASSATSRPCAESAGQSLVESLERYLHQKHLLLVLDNVVQVLDEGEKNMIGQWTFVQADRPRVTEENVVMFKETREGSTPAVQYWYFPGEKIGKEFIYPKDQAERIAARQCDD